PCCAAFFPIAALSYTATPRLHSPFSLYCDRTHRDLHSFPTRRSSDLSSCAWRANAAHGPLRRTRAPPPRPPRARRTRRRRARSRSEEHTSELQSRFDLVCRLLLEKKNQQNRETSAY